ncbi:PH domain-containing protein [uncultured Actinomyces sp.]|uniref:PH domain-containing protein n=1 Tax=uncultured Actinomyces sp. TaxID=249061 RepID=UPI0028E2DA34|nr:PH domain-containing protein [uncultured Actinomyces sp.]
MSPRNATDVLSPAGIEFQHVSPRLAALRLGNALAACGALCGAISGLVLIVGIPALWWLMLVPALIALLCLWLIPAQVRALRYALAETDFVIRRGVINRSLTLVPYGRIQYVDIKQGPVQRFMGIATIKLSTASAKTDATLSGVPVADAVGLRDVLAERGSAELMGL